MSAHATITRTAITRRCEACDGDGFKVVNNTDPFGYGPDPQCDEGVECEACAGTGEVTVWADPLLVLRNRRRWAGWPPRGSLLYGEARALAMSPLDRPLPDASMAEIDRQKAA